MIRHRSGAPRPESGNEGSSDDDAFSSFGRKKKRKSKGGGPKQKQKQKMKKEDGTHKRNSSSNSNSSSISNSNSTDIDIRTGASTSGDTSISTTSTNNNHSSSINNQKDGGNINVKSSVFSDPSTTSGTTSKSVDVNDPGGASVGGGAGAGDGDSGDVNTSSNKRHHFQNQQRAARMDALIQDLKGISSSSAKKDRGDDYYGGGGGGNHGGGGGIGHGSHHPDQYHSRNLPDKMGSYVMPGEEHSTTNVFVGNLSPLTTEEQLTDIFSQFGDLYSVKIMWPRTPEEHARGRNTGFVCFMHRDDAQDAMDALQDADPLNSGRRMFLNWGKNVKKVRGPSTTSKKISSTSIASHSHDSNNVADASSEIGNNRDDSNCRFSSDENKTGTRRMGMENVHTKKDIHGKSMGVPVDEDADADADADVNTKGEKSDEANQWDEEKYITYDPKLHEADAIRVQPPSDSNRLELISQVALFVAKDGSVLENKLMDKESTNPKFAFLRSVPHTHTYTGTYTANDSLSINTGTTEDANCEIIRQERLYYRWRVYSYLQGDETHAWRTDPFQMIHPHGKFWVPPPLDPRGRKTMEQVQEENRRQEAERLKQIQQRKRRRRYATGRQMEHGNKAAAEGNVKLNPHELEKWRELIDTLTSSKESICKAMAFFFDKSAAAYQVSSLLEVTLLDNRVGISVDTKCARLYLMSDVLFNSQQPGVKNAFRYRDAIERMAPKVFECLGKHGQDSKGTVTVGRITMSKLRSAVRGVLNAWDSWFVYSALFLDQLEALFEGKPLPKAVEENDDNGQKMAGGENDTASSAVSSIPQPRSLENTPSSIWMVASNVDSETPASEIQAADSSNEASGTTPTTRAIEPGSGVTPKRSDTIKDAENADIIASLIDESIDGQSLGESEVSDTIYQWEDYANLDGDGDSAPSVEP